MVQLPFKIKEIIERYLKSLKQHNIPVKEAILFGSYAKGNYQEWSDIDIAIVSEIFVGDRIDDKDKISSEYVILKTKHGQTQPLKIKFVKTIKSKTLFCTFHHAQSHINYIFGDESDVNTKTALFKSLEVEVIF